MFRRKVPHYVPQAASSATNSPTSKDHVSTRDYHNWRYKEVDKKGRCRDLYEGSGESYKDRMEGLFIKLRLTHSRLFFLPSIMALFEISFVRYFIAALGSCFLFAIFITHIPIQQSLEELYNPGICIAPGA